MTKKKQLFVLFWNPSIRITMKHLKETHTEKTFESSTLHEHKILKSWIIESR